MTHRDSIFDAKMKMIAPAIEQYGDYDLVIGIPFSSTDSEMNTMLASVDKTLQEWMGRRQVFICVGDCNADKILQSLEELSLRHPLVAFLMPEEISGRGSSIAAIIEICRRLDAELLIFSAGMANENGPGIEDSWLESLLTPIQGEYDIVLGSLRRYMGTDSIAHMLGAPILEAFYGARVSDPLGGIYAIAPDFVEELAHEIRFWGESIAGYGIDFWILTRALVWGKNICEVNMGGKVALHDLETRNRIFFDNAYTIFEALKRDSAIWLQDRLVIKVADILVRSEVKQPDLVSYPISALIQRFKRGIEESLEILTNTGLRQKIEKAAFQESLYIDDELWVEVIFDLLLQFAFGEESDCYKLLGLITALYNARVVSYVQEMDRFAANLERVEKAEKEQLMVRKMESIRNNLTNQFWLKKNFLNEAWIKRREQVKPPIIPLGYMEYVPGKPIVVPKKITGKDKRQVHTDNIFRELRKEYEDKFNSFITGGLGLSVQAAPYAIIKAVEGFMCQLEDVLGSIFPGDLTSYEGLEKFVGKLFSIYPQQMFTINDDLLREMLIRFPPINLIIPMGYYKAADLVENMDPRDAVSYANLMDNWNYTDRDLIWLVDNLKPESFAWVDVKPLILDEELHLGGSISQGKISNLNRVTGRIAVKMLYPGAGGKYPRLRYFTDLVRRIAAAENYSGLFRLNVAQRKKVGTKVKNSLLGLDKGEDFSAHNIFENCHHRKLVDKVRKLAEYLQQQGEEEKARIINLMADGYGLSQVLEDGTFLTCTAWSWASYSFKGGLKIPTPFTTSVEGRWFNHNFLEYLYSELGYSPDEVMNIAFRLIQEGKSNNNLLDTLLPTRPRDVAVVVQETTNEPSRHLRRFSGNPLLEPIPEHSWESKYVLNPGALRIKDKVYLFYRAVGEDNISHIGLAITDGYEVLERISQPIFSPLTPEEKMGCEDPRVIIINNRIIMLYTAYDGNIAQIAIASIGVNDFAAGNYTNWKREGLVFTNIWDKDAVMLPERINNKYVIYHRIEPSIWVTYMPEMKFPLKEKHAIILGPRAGRMWDSLKIGAGAQPLKTKYGWLLIYHGVDHNYVYRLGVLLVDLENPQRVIYRSPNPILEPEEDFEIGLGGAWVPNVVFTCGAVPEEDKDILEDDDRILVYYGAADTSIGLATATLAELVPEKFRQQTRK